MTCKLKLFYGLAITLLFLCNNAIAQKDTAVAMEDSVATVTADDSTNSSDYTPDDTTITQTAFGENNDSVAKWKRSREFAYMTYLDSFLHKKNDLRSDTMNIEENSLSKTKSAAEINENAAANGALNSLPVKVILWLLAIFFIGFILYRLFFKSGLFTGRRAKVINDESVPEEEIHSYSEYDHLISEAEANKDFNLAIRYLYLQTLIQLSEKELIVFSAEKMNNQYVQELFGRTYQQQFQSLTRNYEYIWYGKFAIESNSYYKLKDQFIVFNNEI